MPLSLATDRLLDWERQHPGRWEWISGRAEMLEDVTLLHDLVGNGLRSALLRRLRGTGCHVHGSQLKVVTPRDDILYPDAFVLCGPSDPDTEIVDSPVVVFEVVSATSAQHDLTRKRLAYKTIPSLKVIVYVAQERARLDIVRRQADGRWDDDEPVLGLEGELMLPEIGVTLGMAGIYEDVEVEAA